MRADKLLDKMLEAKENYDSELIADLEEPDYVPDSWLDDDGVRHITVWETGLDTYMRLVKVNGKWQLRDTGVF